MERSLASKENITEDDELKTGDGNSRFHIALIIAFTVTNCNSLTLPLIGLVEAQPLCELNR